MAEPTPSFSHLSKSDAYGELDAIVAAALPGVDDRVAGMATFASIVHHAFGHLWTGFYRVVEPGKRLRVGPYQGTLGTIDIAFGRGVCGSAAATEETLIVPDVHLFPGHITCDARARSEIAIPVLDEAGMLWAVLDVDSDQPAAFDEVDALALKRLLQHLR